MKPEVTEIEGIENKQFGDGDGKKSNYFPQL